MGTDPAFAIQTIDVSVLTPVVRKLVQRETFTIQDWSVKKLGGGAGNPVSVGLYRLQGIGQDQEERIPWSIILKVIQSPDNAGWTNIGEGEDQTHWNYWKREPLLYGSGLLETLPHGMTAPRCIGTSELPGKMVWLWLEDIIDSYKGAWPLDRYALTARHLGRFNGMHPSELVKPPFAWLSTHRLQQWLALLPWQNFPWEHPQVLAHYPRAEKNSFRRLLAENEDFLAKLEWLPQAVCHGDTYPTNFMSRDLLTGQEQTVALDWALTGIAPLGADLGQLVFGAQTNLKEADRIQVEEALFASYMDGLRDSGCQVEPQHVRFGYTAFAALQVGLFQVYLLNEGLKHAETVTQQVAERPEVPDCFEVVMADEAYQLLDLI